MEFSFYVNKTYFNGRSLPAGHAYRQAGRQAEINSG